MNRCAWVKFWKKIRFISKYHDVEWGVPKHSDQELYELLILESFQAGLSWECILNKREAFRAAYDNFDIEKVIHYDEGKNVRSCSPIPPLSATGGRWRQVFPTAVYSDRSSRSTDHLMRISGAIRMAGRLWRMIHYELLRLCPTRYQRISKKRGMKFVGSTIIYSYLQAVGIINGHETDCFLCRRVLQ